MSLGFHVVRNQRYMKRLVRNYMTSSRNILKLHNRGILQNVFPEEKSPDLYHALIGQPQCLYCGFDPTAESLHIGNLLTIVTLLHAQRAGHKIIALLGGATAQIGDPSGRNTERSAVDLDTITKNVNGIKQSLEKIFLNHSLYFSEGCNKETVQPLILDNAEWYSNRNIVEFLSSVGRHFRMGTMLSRQSVQSRLASVEGMSFTEFTYQIFQAYDWLHLFRKYQCLIQVGGNDQTGNIMSGHDLISRIANKTVFGLTVPLITSTAGDKLGKTAGNAVWLNANKTSPYELYQYFLRLPDTDIERYLKLFTFFSEDTIKSIMTKHKVSPERRLPQYKLAEEVTRLVHGPDDLSSAERCSEALFHQSSAHLAELTSAELSVLFKNTPTQEMVLEPGTTLIDVTLHAGCFNREVDARRIISGGGLQVNHRKQTNPDTVLLVGEHVLRNGITLLRVGKKNYYIVKWLDTGIL